MQVAFMSCEAIKAELNSDFSIPTNWEYDDLKEYRAELERRLACQRAVTANKITFEQAVVYLCDVYDDVVYNAIKHDLDEDI